MQDQLKTAIAFHEAGRLDEAAAIYQQLLATEEDNAGALHLLGVLHHQRRDPKRAIELISRAVAIRPTSPAFHANLAEAYRAIGDLDRAVGCCQAALRLAPDFPEALNNLGLALWEQGKRAEAAARFRRSLELNPRAAMTHSNLGIILREQNEMDEARQEFEAALKCDPNFAAARTNLGQLFLDWNRPEEALPHCQEAVRLQPDQAVLHHNLGNALRDLKRNVDARVEYLEALRLNPDLVEALTQLGLMLQREGKFADALPWLKQAADLDSKNATAWQRLAELHEARDDCDAAAQAWSRAVAIEPRQPAARVSYGWQLQEQGRIADATEQYKTALEINPEWSAAHLNMGGILEEQGKLAEAEACFRAALKANPDYALPHARLAGLLRGKLPPADLKALEDRLADEKLADPVRSHLLFALAHVLDARAEYSKAADCLSRANSLCLAESQIDHRAYVPAQHETFVDSLIATFTPDLFSRLAGAGSPSRRPIFVLGLPRSGTTLIEQVLASHSAIHAAGELRLIRQAYESAPALSASSPADIRRLADAHLEKLASLDATKSPHIVDKMPDNYMYLGFLSLLFPSATFIHCRRDLRDIAVSCWMTDFRSITWANDPAHIAHRFSQYRRLMDHWAKTLPIRLHHVDYESAVANIESTSRALIAACGLKWEPACLQFHQTSRPIRTASVTQVRKPVYSSSVGRWKNYQDTLAEMFAKLP